MATKKAKKTPLENELGISLEEIALATWRDIAPLERLWVDETNITGIKTRVNILGGKYTKALVEKFNPLSDSICRGVNQYGDINHHEGIEGFGHFERYDYLKGPVQKYWAKLLNRKEAWFWFCYLTSEERDQNLYTTLEATFENVKKQLNIHLNEQFHYSGGMIREDVAHTLLSILSFEELIELIFELDLKARDLFDALHRVSIFQSKEVLEPFYPQLRERIAKASSDNRELAPWIVMAAALRDSETVEKYTDRLDFSEHTGRFDAKYPRGFLILSGLSSQEKIEEYYDTVGVRRDNKIFYSYWLALTGADRLDFFNCDIMCQYDGAKTFALLKKMLHPKTAPYFLSLANKHSVQPKYASEKKNSAAMYEWLDTNLSIALIGITQAATENPLEEYLVWLKEKYVIHGAVAFHAITSNLSEAEISFLKDNGFLTVKGEGGIDEELQQHRKTRISEEFFCYSHKKVKPWIALSQLPPLSFKGEPISDTERDLLLKALHSFNHYSPDPYLAELKSDLDAEALDQFGWEVAQQWIDEGMKSGEKWALDTLRYTGGAYTVDNLASLIDGWSIPQAKTGVSILRLIGTDKAFDTLHFLSREASYQRIRESAASALELLNDLAAE